MEDNERYSYLFWSTHRKVCFIMKTNSSTADYYSNYQSLKILDSKLTDRFVRLLDQQFIPSVSKSNNEYSFDDVKFLYTVFKAAHNV